MPSYFSDLKSVYKRTYEELKNPQSPIAIFLEKIDDYERLENAGPIKTAIQEYIELYEKEEKNFKEPDVYEGRISYKYEQIRLRKNLEVEKKLEKAVRSMQDALDSFAISAFGEAKKYTHEDIMKVKDHREQLRLQKDRMLNAIYGIEVDLENRMIEKLKADYQLFDHRPMESKVATPPFVRESPQYKMRHIEIRGSAKIPTALYGLMRFRDLMNDHDSMIEEAERSRQYEKFVNDRLAGFQAWKNTLSIEQDIYNEIKAAVDEEYFKKYNKFMDDFAGTSCVAGYQSWYLKTYKEIDELKDEIEKYENEQKQLDDTYAQSVNELEETKAELELEEKNFTTNLEELEKSPYLSQEFYEKNETDRTEAEKELSELEKAAKEMDAEIELLKEEESAAKKTMLENVQRIQNYTNELKQLQEHMENNAQEALKNFLDKHEETAKKLDENLYKTVEKVGAMVKTMDFHNENIAKAEKGIETYSKEVQEFRAQIDAVTKAYEEEEKQAKKDLKASNTIGQKLIRTFNLFGEAEKSKQELQRAEDQKEMVEDFGKKIKELQDNIKKSEANLAKEQENLGNYKQAWEKIYDDLKIEVKDGCEYSSQLQFKLSQLKTEKEEVTIGYEEQVKEIKQTSEETQQTYSSILDKTSAEFDILNEKKRLKSEEWKKLQERIKEAKNKIEECKNNTKNIQNAKESKEALLKLKEQFPAKKAAAIKLIEDDMQINRDRCIWAKKQESEKRMEVESTIKSHDKLFEFYKQGKVTSNRVLEDLAAALTETLKIAHSESQKQVDYIRSKEMKLMGIFAAKMKDPNLFAERVRDQKDTKEEQKDTKVKAGVYDYMEKLSSMKMFNSKSFEKLKNAVMKNFSPDGTLLVGQIAADEKERDAFLSQLSADKKKEIQFENSVKQVKANLKELADCAKTYIQEKGSASRFTKAGKERYRFADEMRTMAEVMLASFERYDIEKKKAEKLKILDDSELYVSKKLSFYKTESYDMTKGAFVKNGQVDKMDMMGLKVELPEGKKKDENLKEEIKEEIVKEDDSELQL